MDRSLDDLLNGDVEAEEVAVPETQEEIPAEPAPEEASEGPQRDENGRFVSTKGVEPEAEPPSAPDHLPQDVYEPLKAVRNENKALKEQLEALTRQIQAVQQPQEPPAPPPSIWEDEEGWQQQFGSQVVTQAVQQATLNAKLDMSEMMVRQANPDFEEVKAEFLALAEQNPELRQQALSDPHPWNKAYQIAKNARTMRELGATDVATLEARLREQIMAELQGQAPARPMAAPPTLTTERSVGSRTGPAWAGPKSLSDLLG
jgi:hypothetical protein